MKMNKIKLSETIISIDKLIDLDLQMIDNLRQMKLYFVVHELFPDVDIQKHEFHIIDAIEYRRGYMNDYRHSPFELKGWKWHIPNKTVKEIVDEDKDKLIIALDEGKLPLEKWVKVDKKNLPEFKTFKKVVFSGSKDEQKKR